MGAELRIAVAMFATALFLISNNAAASVLRVSSLDAEFVLQRGSLRFCRCPVYSWCCGTELLSPASPEFYVRRGEMEQSGVEESAHVIIKRSRQSSAT